MRKRIVPTTVATPTVAESEWVDVRRDAEVELTSEDAEFPVESALGPATGAGWRAAEPGPQTIRLHFDRPRDLRRIRLVFDERQASRTQEVALRWAGGGERTYREIVRQQYTFSPQGASREVEDYAVELRGVSSLELSIVPDISGGAAKATLSEWRVA